jgi:hypothetical protein
MIGGFDFHRQGVPYGVYCQQLAPPLIVDTNSCVQYTTFLSDPSLSLPVSQHWTTECGNATHPSAMTGMTSAKIKGSFTTTSFTCCKLNVIVQ